MAQHSCIYHDLVTQAAFIRKSKCCWLLVVGMFSQGLLMIRKIKQNTTVFLCCTGDGRASSQGCVYALFSCSDLWLWLNKKIIKHFFAPQTTCVNVNHIFRRALHGLSTLTSTLILKTPLAHMQCTAEKTFVFLSALTVREISTC